MKISEQILLDKEFPFQIYDKEGNITKVETIRVKELLAMVIIGLRKRSMVNGKLDEGKLAQLTASKMIVDAPFESEDDKKWVDMDESSKVEFLTKLSTTYVSQLSNMIRELQPQITEEEKNL